MGHGITSKTANGLSATDMGEQHNSRQLMDRVQQTWGMVLQARQQMDWVPQTWESNITVGSWWTEWNRHGVWHYQYCKTANGTSAMDMGQQYNSRQLMDKVKQTWGMVLQVRQQMDWVPQTWNNNITVDSWWPEWNRHGAWHYQYCKTANATSAMDMGQQYNSRQLMDKVKQTWGMVLQVRQQMDWVPQTWNNNITVDSWWPEWNRHGAWYYKQDSKWTECHRHGTTI